MPVPRHASVTRAVGALSVTALLLCGAVPPAQAADPSAPLHKEPTLAYILATSGTDSLVRVEGKLWLHHGDDRMSWVPSALPEGEDSVQLYSVDGGKLYYGDENTGKLGVYTTSTNTVETTSVDTDLLRDARAGRLLFDGEDGQLTVRPLAGAGAPWVVAHQPPAWSDDISYRLAGAIGVLAMDYGNDGDGQVSLLKEDGSPSVLVPRTVLLDTVVTGDAFWYAAAVSGGLKVCRVQLATSSPSCRSLASASSDERSYRLVPGAGGVLLRSSWYGHENSLKWFAYSGGDLAAPVAVPTSALEVELAERTDGVAPPTISAVSLKSSYLQKVSASGSLGTPIAVTPAGTETARVQGLALTPTTLLGGDDRRSAPWQSAQEVTTLWKRSVGTGVGAEAVLGTGLRGSAVASAGRWTVGSAAGVKSYDRGVVTGTTQKPGVRLERQSGPYLLGRDGVLRTASGSWQTVEGLSDVFGGLGVIETDSPLETEGRYIVRDFTGAGRPDIAFTLKADDLNSGAQIWGDWVAVAYDQHSGEDDWVPGTLLYNFRTKASKKCAGYPVALGDGVVVSVTSDWTTACLFGNGEVRKLSYGEANVAVDGSRVAYTVDGKVVITRIAGAGTSAPRSLGVVAAPKFSGRSWTPQIDLTKPVAAGKLRIKNSSGTVVRSLSVPASADGSIRGVSWDVLDSSGKKVPAGTYSFWLTNPAADGSGAVVRVDGTAGALGTVSVRYLSAATPKITGTRRVGRTLKVATGSWSPTPSFSYKWYRSGKAISGATRSSYKLTKADKGKTIKVKVTGARSGYVTVAKYSKSTAKVR